MATTTPNYGWSVPTSSDLVKNGATDIETLGDSVDASLWNSGFGQAGKNKIMNGDFGIWQRGTSFTNPTTGAYLADRYRASNSVDPTSRTISQQTFTPGTAPVAGYESQFFLRSVLTTVGSSTAIRVQNMIEDVRTLAGQTATFSFWAKSDTTRIQPIPSITQNFGSGGSTAVDTNLSAFTTETGWQRFSFTFTVPSISGKTIGAGSHLRITMLQNMTAGNTLDTWGWQLEYGSKATPFQTASGGSPQAELAMCQRYYIRYGSAAAAALNGSYYSTTSFYGVLNFPTMRTAPTFSASGVDAFDVFRSGASVASTGIFGGQITTTSIEINATTSASTAGVGAFVRFKSSGSPYLEFSSEL